MAATREQLKQLTATIPSYKWKVQTASVGGCQCVAYIDARDMQRQLDDCVGPENWQSQYQLIDGSLYGGIGINCDRGDHSEWVWKWDCGTESMTEKEKGQASDALKRAAVAWGVGRFLYDLEIQKVKAVDYKGKFKPADDSGKVFWSNDDLSNYITARMNKTSVKPPVKPATPAPVVDDKRNEKYSQGGKPVEYATSGPSQEIMDRISKLNRDGKVGKLVLVDYLGKYNIKNSTDYSPKDLGDGTLLVKVLEFIESTPPTGV